jgi:hypothetical protein
MGRKYAVYVAGTDERIDKRGLTLTKAKQLARIGSQKGEAREVVRGCCGMIIREYIGGERVYPVEGDHLEDFYDSEVPKELR